MPNKWLLLHVSIQGIRMKNLRSIVGVSSLVLAAVLMLAPATAGTVTYTRRLVTNPAGVCQGALPAFETAIRKRPLAIQNEGTSHAFVTCAFTSQGSISPDDEGNPAYVSVYVSSNSGTELIISCTGVSGYQRGDKEFIVKTARAPASGGPVQLSWTAAEFEGAPVQFPSGFFGISCNLPPGAAINETYVIFVERTQI